MLELECWKLQFHYPRKASSASEVSVVSVVSVVLVSESLSFTFPITITPSKTHRCLRVVRMVALVCGEWRLLDYWTIGSLPPMPMDRW